MFEPAEEARAFLRHLLREDQLINEKLDVVLQIWQARMERAQTSKLMAALVDLRHTLADHFDEENRGACIDEAAARAPQFRKLATALEHEHPVLLEEIDRIIAGLGSAIAAGRSEAALPQDFRAFAERLRRHETSENELLEHAFGVEGDEWE